jgi:CheY-like chemotaxis protein
MPIVVLTAYLEQNDKQKLIKAGANDCLLKPLDIDLLAYTVRRLTE